MRLPASVTGKPQGRHVYNIPVVERSCGEVYCSDKLNAALNSSCSEHFTLRSSLQPQPLAVTIKLPRAITIRSPISKHSSNEQTAPVPLDRTSWISTSNRILTTMDRRLIHRQTVLKVPPLHRRCRH